MQKEALGNYLYFPYSRDAVVTNMRGEPILNAKGETMTHHKTYGQWSAQEPMNQLLSALTHVHRNGHGFGPEYSDQCADSFTVYKEKGVGGCVHHGIPLYTRRGDVTTCALVQDTVTHLKHTSTHIVNGACHLLPSDLRDVRAYATAKNDIFYMEIYVLLLLLIDLFLRRNEYSSLAGENFNTKLFLLTDHFVIEALNVSVKGKKTQTKERRSSNETYACWRKLWVHGDDICGDVDTKRHLLAFLYSIGWKGGYLFPTKAELAQPPVDGVYKTFIGEDALHQAVKTIFTTVIKRKDKLTSHTGRKTGYFWGRLRGASVEQNMQAANHIIFTTAKKYMKDAEALTTIIRKVNDPKERLGKWSSCYCANGEETGMRATAPMAKYQVGLKELVVGFIEQLVGVSPLHPRCREPKHLLDGVLTYKKPRSPYNELDTHLKDVSSDKTAAVLSCVHSIEAAAFKRAKAAFEEKLHKEAERLCADHVLEFGGYLLHKQSASNKTVGVIDVDALFTSFMEEKGMHGYKREGEDTGLPEPKKLKEVRGKKTVEGRQAFPKMGMVDRIEFLDKVYSDDHAEYENADRQFLIRAKIAVVCYRQCCNRSFDSFMAKYGQPTRRKTSQPALIFQLKEIKGCETC